MQQTANYSTIPILTHLVKITFLPVIKISYSMPVNVFLIIALSLTDTYILTAI
jgi:hypothetical protein